MADNKKYKGRQDRNRVDSNDPSEVEYLHSRFPKLTHRVISAAVKAAGPMRESIIQYLLKNYQ